METLFIEDTSDAEVIEGKRQKEIEGYYEGSKGVRYIDNNSNIRYTEGRSKMDEQPKVWTNGKKKDVIQKERR